MYSVKVFCHGKQVWSVCHVDHDTLHNRLRSFLYYYLDIRIIDIPYYHNIVELIECIAHNGYDVYFWNGYSKKNYKYSHPINHDNVISCEVVNV